MNTFINLYSSRFLNHILGDTKPWIIIKFSFLLYFCWNTVITTDPPSEWYWIILYFIWLFVCTLGAIFSLVSLMVLWTCNEEDYEKI